LGGYVPSALQGTSSQSGLRGAHCIPSFDEYGSGQEVLFTTESNSPIVWRYNPNTGVMHNEVSLDVARTNSWGVPGSTYVIDAYNDATDVGSHGAVAFGEGTTFGYGNSPPPQLSVWSDSYIIANVGIWTRTAAGVVTLNNLPPLMPQAMVAARAFSLSPFGDGSFFTGGFDANSVASHNTAWIVKGYLANYPSMQ